MMTSGSQLRLFRLMTSLVALFSAACSVSSESPGDTGSGTLDTSSQTTDRETESQPGDISNDSDTTAWPAVGGDDCADAIAVSLEAGEEVHYEGDFSQLTDQLDPQQAGCVGQPNKPELFLAFTVPPWHVLIVHELGVINTTIHVLESCGHLVCLATSDALSTDSRTVFNSTDMPLPVILAVETEWAVSGPFDISLSLERRPPGRSCDYAIPVVSQQSWTWQASTWTGYLDNFASGAPDCPSLPAMPEAEDVWFSVSVPPGQILEARDPSGDPVFGGHEVALLASCDSEVCLDSGGGPMGGAVAWWNSSSKERSFGLVLQRSLDLTTPPALEVGVGPPDPGDVCPAARILQTEGAAVHETGSWAERLDTGPSTGPSCSLPVPDGGGEDLWLQVTIPPGQMVIAAETVPVYYRSNLALVSDCQTHACLASGEGGVSWTNAETTEQAAWLHVERRSASQTLQYDVSVEVTQPLDGRSCEHPLAVDALPFVKTLPSGLLPYGDELHLADATCGASAANQPELVLALPLSAGASVGVAVAGATGAVLAIRGPGQCGADTCLALSKSGTLVYIPQTDGTHYLVVEGPYASQNLVITIYED